MANKGSEANDDCSEAVSEGSEADDDCFEADGADKADESHEAPVQAGGAAVFDSLLGEITRAEAELADISRQLKNQVCSSC